MNARVILGGLLFAACSACAWLGSEALTGAAIAFDFYMQIALEAPRALALLAFLPLFAYALFFTLTDLSRVQQAVSLALRALLVSALIFALARPVLRQSTTRASAVVLFDVSDSVTDEDLKESAELLRALEEARGDDALAAFTFASRATPLDIAASRSLEKLARPKTPEGAHTDLEAALRLAYSALEPGALPRILLVSDGHETRGDLLREASRAARLGVPIFHHTLARGRPAEIAVQRIELPETLEVGRSFDVTVHVLASQAARARVQLYQGEVLNGLDASREIELAQGDNALRFTSIVRVPGEVIYRATIEPKGADRFAENNTASAAVVAKGRPSVLLIDREPAQARRAADALSVADFEVDLRDAHAAPRSLAELARYDFVILSDVPRDQLADETLDALERYMRDLGGGFMMVGGEQSFGLGGYEGSKLEALLPVRMQSERRRDEHSLALALVIDCSGSMSGPKIELAKEAARATAEVLGPSDSLGVIGFSGSPERRVRMQSAANRLRIIQDIARLSAQGGTAIFPALDMALTDLLSVRARIKHVILLTDGQTQESGIPELTQSMRAEGITVTAVGLGTDVNRPLMEQIASLGGGRAYFTADPENVPRIFVRETSSVVQSSVIEEITAAIPVEPADCMKGIDFESAPLLRGYVATQARTRPAQVLLASEQGDPLLARIRIGLGWSLAFTPDLKPRWASEWLRWSALPKLLGQVVREHMRTEHEGELPLRATLEGDEVRVSVDAIGKDDRFLNGLESTLTLEGPLALPSAERTKQTVQLGQRAPGFYSARIPLDRVGTFALTATHRLEGSIIARSRAQLSNPYPSEYAALRSSGVAPKLAAASEITHGAALGAPSALFDDRGEHLERATPLWPRLVLAAIALALLDLLTRRLRFGLQTKTRV